jgi:hypothetical protein
LSPPLPPAHAGHSRRHNRIGEEAADGWQERIRCEAAGGWQERAAGRRMKKARE